jgi:hypothetical protein
LRNLYDERPDEDIKQLALAWIARDEDPKYRKKYASLWKQV